MRILRLRWADGELTTAPWVRQRIVVTAACFTSNGGLFLEHFIVTLWCLLYHPVSVGSTGLDLTSVDIVLWIERWLVSESDWSENFARLLVLWRNSRVPSIIYCLTSVLRSHRGRARRSSHLVEDFRCLVAVFWNMNSIMGLSVNEQLFALLVHSVGPLYFDLLISRCLCVDRCYLKLIYRYLIDLEWRSSLSVNHRCHHIEARWLLITVLNKASQSPWAHR